MPLDADVAGLLQLIEQAGYPPMSEGTPEDARAGLRALMQSARDLRPVAEVGDVTDVRLDDRTPARVYRPAADAQTPTVVFFHGGGFVIGDLDTADAACRLLCHDTGAVVVSVDYPLAPEHPFPAAVDAAWAALRWVHEHIDEFGADAARLAVGGDSAGGNLAAVCAQRAHAEGLALAAQLLVYPAVDLLGDYPSRTENAEGYLLTLADMQWFGAQYLGMDETDPRAVELARDPRLSPLLADTLAGLAPAVVATAEFDPLRDEGNAYASALAAAGVSVAHRQFAGLIHGFYGMEAVSPAIADASAWLNHQLATLLAHRVD